jgi:hypothetical protein
MEGTFVKFGGWAITVTSEPAGEFLLRFDSNERTIRHFHLARIDRPDVVSVHPHAQQGCGFELAFPVETLFALQKDWTPNASCSDFEGSQVPPFRSFKAGP